LSLRQNGKAAGIVAGYVMAGGASRRFGSDKALVEFGGKTLLSRMCGLLEATAGSASIVAPRGRYVGLGFSVVEDRWPDEGPLGGVITALRATAETDGGRDWNLMVSCDMPFLTREWLSFMIGRALTSDAEVIVPQSENGLEPLCACWRTPSSDALQAAFDGGVRKVTEAMKLLRMEVLDETHWKRFDSAGRLFWNMNTLEDYATALQMWEPEQT
jgi:molybdopterin-guanine dinucleotide biosynthesis protein A